MGRKPKSPVDHFQTIAWYQTIANWMGYDLPNRLERHFQPHLVRKDSDGCWRYSGSWDDYQKGAPLPKEGYREDGAPYAVTAARLVPGALYIFRHPIWEILRLEKIAFEKVVENLARFPMKVTRYYIDPTSETLDELFESFVESVGLPIWIDVDDDADVSLDHLAIQLMILKMDNFKYLSDWRRWIAANISQTLGPLASSVWFNKTYEGFYDFLETSVWGDLFDKHYQYLGSAKGWRRTKTDWVKSSCY